MFLNKKKATAEITTALLCRSNVSKNTFKTVIEYLDDSEVRHILDVCISTLEARGISQDKVLAKMIDNAVSNPDSFDSVAEHIDSGKLQYILSSCGSTIVKMLPYPDLNLVAANALMKMEESYLRKERKGQTVGVWITVLTVKSSTSSRFTS